MFMHKDQIVLAENMIFDNDIEHRGGINGHVLLVGPTGCGKTTSHIIPSLLRMDGSFVIVDYKGNMRRKLNGYFLEKGYEVKQIDFVDVTKSAYYNPLRYITTEQDITRVAEILTTSVKGGNDPFWEKSATMLLRSLISIVVNENMPEKRNMRSLIDLIDRINISELDGKTVSDSLTKYVEELIKNGRNYRGLKDYLSVENCAVDTYRSIVVTLKTALGKFMADCVLDMTETDETNIESMATKKTALFIRVSDTDRSMDELATLLFTQLFQQLCSYADKMCEDNDNRLPLAVHFVFDDFATGCPIPDFDRIISNIRSRNMTVMLGIQSMQQLNMLYKDNGKIIFDNCDNRVFFSSINPEVIEAASKISNFSEERIRNMKLDEVLVVRRGEKPVLAKRHNTYTDDLYIKMLRKAKVKS